MHTLECAVKYLVKILVIIGALELGIMGIFGYDVIGTLFGGVSMMATRVAFGVIGVAGVLMLICCLRSCCGGGSCGSHKGGKDKGHGGGCCR